MEPESSAARGRAPASLHRRPLFLLKLSLYVATGILQPMIVDALRLRSCLGRKALLLPTLAKTAGMALVGILSTGRDRRTLRRLLRRDDALRDAVLVAAGVDLLSGMLLTGGILLTGGAVFVVLYNSCPAWTALLSKYFLGRSLSRRQTWGVVVVVLGLICNVLGTTEQLLGNRDHLASVVGGSGIVILGCVLHSAFFVLSDMSLRGYNNGAADASDSTLAESKGFNHDCHSKRPPNSIANNGDIARMTISPPLWSSCLGTLEAAVMTLYVSTSILLRGFHDDPALRPQLCPPNELTKGFITMLLVDSVHSAAFFLMLRQIGAVGSALLKGTQSVSVVALSAVFFCPHEKTQCLTVVKGVSVVLMLSGMFLYAVGSNSGSRVIEENGITSTTAMKQQISGIEKEKHHQRDVMDDILSVELKSLLDT
ncbi:hypothetical protein ACHAWF_010027 [Thalassiosira exigua]